MVPAHVTAATWNFLRPRWGAEPFAMAIISRGLPLMITEEKCSRSCLSSVSSSFGK